MTISTAVLSIFTALLGIVLGHILADRKSRREELSRIRLEAYTDFLNAVSVLVSTRRLGCTENQVADLGVLNDAKTRICVCGDTDVVKALESFWLQGGTLEKEFEIIAYARLCKAMRKSLGQANLAHDIRLSDVLFKLEPSSYSYRSTAKESIS